MTRSSHLSACATLAAVLAWTGVAVAGAITISPNDLRENFSNEVAVSGEVRVGVVAGSTIGPRQTDPLSLHVQLPGKGPRRLCVRFTSRDGRYHAEGSALLEDGQSGDTVVAVPTRFGKELAAKNSEVYLAPMITLSNDERCRGKVEAILAARWGDSAGQEPMTILVNSGGLAASVSYTGPEGRGSKDCTPMKGAQLLAFDTVCELPMTPGIHDLVIERHEFSDVLRVPVPIVVPGPVLP